MGLSVLDNKFHPEQLLHLVSVQQKVEIVTQSISGIFVTYRQIAPFAKTGKQNYKPSNDCIL
jgi:hypothetical protein